MALRPYAIRQQQRAWVLLTKVAAAALHSHAAAQVDRLQFLLRTVIELDPAHVTLLVLTGRLEDDD
jgi:hypothetical protein